MKKFNELYETTLKDKIKITSKDVKKSTSKTIYNNKEKYD